MSARPFLTFCAAALALAVCPAQQQEAVSRGARAIARLASEPLDWKLPLDGAGFNTVKTASGVTFRMKADPSVPVVFIRCRVMAGALYDAGRRPLAARVTAGMLRESGCASMTAEAVDAMLDFYSGTLEVRCARDWVEVDASIASSHAEKLVQVLGGILAAPAFSKEKLEYVVRRIQTEEAAAADDPFYLCRRQFFKTLYAGHPYAFLYTSEGAERVTLDDVRSFFSQCYVPGAIQVMVTGDFRERDALSAWEKAYVGHPVGAPPARPAPRVPECRPGVYVLQKDVGQTSIYFGIAYDSVPRGDLIAVQLLNHMLGGSDFASRFTQQVRDKEGLAYRVDSLFDTDQPGGSCFIARCRTKTESTERALDAMLWIVGLFRGGKIGEQEFAAGLGGLRNGFVKRFRTMGDVLETLWLMEVLGRDRSYLDKYAEAVQGATPAQLQSAALRYLDPSKMVFVLVGNLKGEAGRLKKFGPVTLVE